MVEETSEIVVELLLDLLLVRFRQNVSALLGFELVLPQLLGRQLGLAVRIFQLLADVVQVLLPQLDLPLEPLLQPADFLLEMLDLKLQTLYLFLLLLVELLVLPQILLDLELLHVLDILLQLQLIELLLRFRLLVVDQSMLHAHLALQGRDLLSQLGYEPPLLLQAQVAFPQVLHELVISPNYYWMRLFENSK